MMDENNSCSVDLSDKSDTEIIEECERELQQMTNYDQLQQTELPTMEKNVDYKRGEAMKKDNKRGKKESEGSSEEGFVRVIRRRPRKTRIVSDSANENNSQSLVNNSDERMTVSTADEYFEVCLTSIQILPKKMAMAKLLRDEHIKNVTRIKYKSPYKVYIQFDDKKQAELLIHCSTILQSGIRTQFTDEGNLSYGLIKGIDLEMSDQEVLDSLSSSAEIISIRRLKRMNNDGEWVDSETVRLCFKDPICPDYVYAYGCRFKVERYVFPVTQCSGCWKFGHPKKFCPRNKLLCPKCGKEHENCETDSFQCINCKGPHMALDKNCPFFLKEKRLRIIMSEQNITYKKALDIYLEEKRVTNINRSLEYTGDFPLLNTTNKDVSINNRINTSATPAAAVWPCINLEKINEERNSTITQNQLEISVTESVQRESDQGESEQGKSGQRQSFKKKTNKKNSRIEKEKQKNMEVDGFMSIEEPEVVEDKRKKKNEWKFEWLKIFQEIKCLIFSEKQLEEKVLLIAKFVFVEIKSFVISLFTEGEMLKKIFSVYDG